MDGEQPVGTGEIHPFLVRRKAKCAQLQANHLRGEVAEVESSFVVRTRGEAQRGRTAGRRGHLHDDGGTANGTPTRIVFHNAMDMACGAVRRGLCGRGAPNRGERSNQHTPRRSAKKTDQGLVQHSLIKILISRNQKRLAFPTALTAGWNAIGGGRPGGRRWRRVAGSSR